MTDYALVGGYLCTRLIDYTADLGALDSSGFWVVVLPYDSEPVCVRFADVRRHTQGTVPPSLGPNPPAGSHTGSPLDQGQAPIGGSQESIGGPEQWSSTLDREAFISRVEAIRAQIADGNVYQVNLTRRLSIAVEDDLDLWHLGEVLRRENPAPYAATISIPRLDLRILSASPELFLARDKRTIRSSPIKGTAAERGTFLEKDWAENVMIVDLVRNDFGRVCEWGTVNVVDLCSIEEHPGLFHMVSTVEGKLRDHLGWPEVIEATFPPGSVTGAPKIAAMDLIEALEPRSRGVYCGAIGWVDADRAVGELNVAIRTFWVENGQLNFGTGGGITHDSVAEGEWSETELKAGHLLAAASMGRAWS